MAPIYCVVKLFKKATFERSKHDLYNYGNTSDSSSLHNTTEKVANKCRICLKEGTIPIFTDDGSSDISETIRKCADIPVSRHDGYPNHLCKACYKLLTDAVLLRSTGKNSYKTLQRTVNKFPGDTSAIQNKKINKQVKATLNKNIFKKYFVPVESDNEGNIVRVNPDKADLLKMPKVQCQVCDKVIMKSYYKEHFTLHEVTPDKFVCDVCGKHFRLRSAYRCHLFTHSTEFPYKCEHCPYRGRHLALLKTHMRTHIQDYKYKCTGCPAKFLFKCNLNRHSLRHKDPIFQCGECKKMFHTRNLVDQHFEVEHLGVKEHMCDYCGKAFGYRKAMMRHQLEVHKKSKRNNNVSGRTPSYLQD